MWLIVVFIVCVALSLVWQIHRAKRTRQNLAALAARLGLNQTPPAAPPALPPIPGQNPASSTITAMPWAQAMLADSSLSGVFQGRPIRFWEYITGGGKNRTSWVALAVTLPAATGLQFHLRRQGFGTSLRQMFGAKEIVVGDPVFDPAWFVESNQPEFFAAALVPDVRAKLMDAVRVGVAGVITLEGGEIKYAETGSFAQEVRIQRLERLLPAMLDLADVAEVFAQTQSAAPPPLS